MFAIIGVFSLSFSSLIFQLYFFLVIFISCGLSVLSEEAFILDQLEGKVKCGKSRLSSLCHLNLAGESQSSVSGY